MCWPRCACSIGWSASVCAAEQPRRVAPAWVQALAPPEWYGRYAHRVETYQMPKTDAARKALAAVMGTNGQVLLHAIDAAIEQPSLGEVPAVQTLRRVWAQQDVEVHGTLTWREVKERRPRRRASLPPRMIPRPGTARSAWWSGWATRSISTETCDPATPHVMVNVETTPATTPDEQMLATVHASLEPRGLLPAEHLVDKGSTDSRSWWTVSAPTASRSLGPWLTIPVGRRERARGSTKRTCSSPGTGGTSCPMGKQRISWLPNTYPPRMA